MFFALIFLLFSKLWSMPLERWDEYTNRAVILASKTRTGYGQLQLPSGNFFEKPPLWYMITYQVTRMTGINPVGLRLISAVSGFIITILLYLTVTRCVSDFAALITFLTLLSIGHLYKNNPANYFSTHNLRSADPDSLYILFLYISLIFFVINSQKRKYFSLIAASCFSGFAVLTKGPGGLLL